MSILLLVWTPAADAQPSTSTYILDDVWLLPDISHPRTTTPRQMTGSFDWTYEEGDFENGSGQFIDLSIPWYNPSIDDLNINVDLNSIEFTLPGNFHDLGVDLTLFLLGNLMPNQPETIDTARSVFDIQQGISYQGHIISGNIVPSLPGDFNNNGVVEQADLDLVLLYWGDLSIPPGWVNDPPTFPIGQDDLDAVRQSWGSATTNAAATTVPEPTSVVLLMVGIGIVCLRICCTSSRLPEYFLAKFW